MNKEKTLEPLPEFPKYPVLPKELEAEEQKLFAEIDAAELLPGTGEIDEYIYSHASDTYKAHWKKFWEVDREISNMGYIIN